MRTAIMILGTLVVAIGHGAVAAETAATSPATPAAPPAGVSTPRASAGRRLFLDVHDLGAGKVNLKAVAGAHQRDLATEAKHGVAFKAYWVDEKMGKIYCLAEAPSRESINDVHKEAHGLMASRIMEVTADNMSWAPTPGAKLYLDVHHLGAGKVTAKAVAAAHQKDLAVGPKHAVNLCQSTIIVSKIAKTESRGH